MAAGIPGVVTWVPDQIATALSLRNPVDPLLVAQDWDDELLDPNHIDWRAYDIQNPAAVAGPAQISGVLHPDSLTSPIIRAMIEFRPAGPDPVLNFAWIDGPSKSIADAVPVKPADGDWMLLSVPALRINDLPFGTGVDMFFYENRNIEVRRFYFETVSPIGDLNRDGVVDHDDLMVVLHNLGANGPADIEDGDANTDGHVDALDVQEVLRAMPESP